MTDDLDNPLAFALAGLVFFMVANIFPFMTFEMEGREQTNNLISGSIELWKAGYWELSTLVFLSSVCLPVLLRSLGTRR